MIAAGLQLILLLLLQVGRCRKVCTNGILAFSASCCDLCKHYKNRITFFLFFCVSPCAGCCSLFTNQFLSLLLQILIDCFYPRTYSVLRLDHLGHSALTLTPASSPIW